MGGDFLTPEQSEVLKSGKTRRGEFTNVPLANIMSYTQVELQVLARMMIKMREGLKGLDLKLRDWHGAGCIAQAMMAKDRVAEFYPEVSAEVSVDNLSEPLAWALRAYFGGRVEMIKQGVHKPQFWNYDISSAYPHILRQLPHMRKEEAKQEWEKAWLALLACIPACLLRSRPKRRPDTVHANKYPPSRTRRIDARIVPTSRASSLQEFQGRVVRG
jgi:hypothetical protein